MQKYEIEGGNGRNTLFIKGKPDIKILSRQDFNALVSALELEIREYYKNMEESKADKPP
jgi:hypothetical protein